MRLSSSALHHSHDTPVACHDSSRGIFLTRKVQARQTNVCMFVRWIFKECSSRKTKQISFNLTTTRQTSRSAIAGHCPPLTHRVPTQAHCKPTSVLLLVCTNATVTHSDYESTIRKHLARKKIEFCGHRN